MSAGQTGPRGGVTRRSWPLSKKEAMASRSNEPIPRLGQIAGHAIPCANGITGDVSAAVGHKGFKAEIDDLRERMCGLGFGHDEIAAELARRYRVRPRESYRLAHGWSLDHAAMRFNAQAAKEDAGAQVGASLTGSRLCEFEKWPDNGRKPSVLVLCMLAKVYETDVLCLLDLADREHIAPEDNHVLLRRPRAATPFGEKLSSLIEARGLSLREVARRVQYSAGYLSNISHGRKRASEHIALRLDELLDAGGELAALVEMQARNDQPTTACHGPVRLRNRSFGVVSAAVSTCTGVITVVLLLA